MFVTKELEMTDSRFAHDNYSLLGQFLVFFSGTGTVQTPPIRRDPPVRFYTRRNKMACAAVMQDVKAINLDLSIEINEEAPLEMAGTELGLELDDVEYETEDGSEVVVKYDTVELGVGSSAVRTCGRGEVEEMGDGDCGGGVSPEGTGEDSDAAELELDEDEGEPLVILVIVNAGLVLPESPYTFFWGGEERWCE